MAQFRKNTQVKKNKFIHNDLKLWFSFSSNSLLDKINDSRTTRTLNMTVVTFRELINCCQGYVRQPKRESKNEFCFETKWNSLKIKTEALKWISLN